MKTHTCLYSKCALAVAISTVTLSASAQESAAAQQEDNHDGFGLQEIVVTTPFRASQAETALPVTVLTGEALQEVAANALGETLKNEIGVNSASFGTGVGQPIIRGQTARRVMNLTNGVGTTDVSAVSPDHVNAVEAIMADRIEVLRGPSTLLYGNGAIGGVVNVIDSRVPETLVDPSFIVQQTRDTVNNEDKTIVRFDGSAGNFAFHFDAFTRQNDNFEIDGFAIDEAAVESLEELVESVLAAEHDDDHMDEHADEDHDHEEDEFDDNTFGFIGNSDAESDGATLGFSAVGNNGFIGFSYNQLNSNYGLPPGTHSHDHHGDEDHEEDYDEDHDEEMHDEDHDEEHEGHDHEDVEFVRLDMESERYDIRSGFTLDEGFFREFRGSVAFTDYQHAEVEVFEDGEREIGTLFSNEGAEGRFTLTHAHENSWEGVWGLQLSDSTFSATGEEAYIAESEIASTGLFAVERYTSGALTAEFGLRFEENSVDMTGGRCEFDDSATSVSGSLLYDVNDDSNLLFGLSRSERTPAVEELFSNINPATCGRFADDELTEHAATALIEVGDPNLDNEAANNIELGYRLNSGPVTGQVSVFYNQIDDFIYLDLSTEAVDGVQVANFLQQDATFRGIEAELSFNLVSNSVGSLDMRLFGDITDAEFDSGGNVPRIPAAKIGAELRFFAGAWSAHLHVTNVQEQDDAAFLELPTDGYTNVSLYADYHFDVANDSELKLFVRGNNLLDDEIRNHASFLRNFAPEPGRGFMVGLRFEY